MEDGSPTTTGKRLREELDEDTKENDAQFGAEIDVNGHDEEEKAPAPQSTAPAAAVEEDGEHNGDKSEEEEEEALVVLELCDFKNHPLFDDYSTATLEGIDTATPMLRIGEYALHGQLEETVGTNYFYDTDTSKAPDKKYRFAGQTIKKIKFTIAPPEDV